MLYVIKIFTKIMDSFELNKIIAAVLLTVLIIIGIGKFTDVLFHVEKPKESAYKIEGLEVAPTLGSSSGVETKVVEVVDIKTLLAMGDLGHGEKVFKKCSACHMIASGGKNMIGPNIWSVIGRTAGSVSDYKYSKAMVAYGKEWTFEEMNSYLIKPQAYVKGTKMAFAGLRKEKDRASVILFMNSKSSSPKSLP
jgi:cytochrome c